MVCAAAGEVTGANVPFSCADSVQRAFAAGPPAFASIFAVRFPASPLRTFRVPLAGSKVSFAHVPGDCQSASRRW